MVGNNAWKFSTVERLFFLKDLGAHAITFTSLLTRDVLIRSSQELLQLCISCFQKVNNNCANNYANMQQ